MQDRPNAHELVEAVREFLERDVMTATSGRIAFHTRVAVNVLAMVERELQLGAQHDVDQRTRLQAIFNQDGSTRELEIKLAAAIRNGELNTEQHAAAVAHIRASVKEKLEVANPKYLNQ